MCDLSRELVGRSSRLPEKSITPSLAVRYSRNLARLVAEIAPVSAELLAEWRIEIATRTGDNKVLENTANNSGDGRVEQLKRA